jgi:hypothetical protein
MRISFLRFGGLLLKATWRVLCYLIYQICIFGRSTQLMFFLFATTIRQWLYPVQVLWFFHLKLNSEVKFTGSFRLNPFFLAGSVLVNRLPKLIAEFGRSDFGKIRTFRSLVPTRGTWFCPRKWSIPCYGFAPFFAKAQLVSLNFSFDLFGLIIASLFLVK